MPTAIVTMKNSSQTRWNRVTGICMVRLRHLTTLNRKLSDVDIQKQCFKKHQNYKNFDGGISNSLKLCITALCSPQRLQPDENIMIYALNVFNRYFIAYLCCQYLQKLNILRNHHCNRTHRFKIIRNILNDI